MVELWGEPLQKRYSNSRCSLAYLFYLGYYIALILVPLYAAYASHGFWKKDGTYMEQPYHNYERRMAMILEGKTPGSILAWSTMSEFNNLLSTGQLRTPSVTSTDIDNNYDGIPDYFELNATMPLQAGEEIHKATLFLFFNSKLTQLARVNQSGMAIITHESYYSGQRLIVNADMLIHAMNPLSSTQWRTDYSSRIMDPSSITSITDILPETVYQRIVQRNETLTLQHRVPALWNSALSPSDFTIQVSLRLPSQHIPYTPSAAEVLKWAWVQYLSLFLLLAYFMSYVGTFVYRYQVVDTFVASDTRPPQKVHQF